MGDELFYSWNAFIKTQRLSIFKVSLSQCFQELNIQMEGTKYQIFKMEDTN